MLLFDDKCGKYWRKMRAKNVDEIDSWGQFHQRFLHAFLYESAFL